MKKRRGNPNWGKPLSELSCNPPVQPTRFELQQKRLWLSDHEVVLNPKMREWAKRNANRYFVPEDLLDFWGIDVNDRLSEIATR